MDEVDILRSLCKVPTVSYYERGVASLISGWCHGFGLTTAWDEFGNLYACHPGVDVQNAKVAFVAHMDHPGYEVVDRQSDREYVAVSHGGMARAAFEHGVEIAAVKSMHDRGPWETVSGRVTGADDVVYRGRFASSSRVRIETSEPLDVLPSPAILDLPDFELRDGMLYGRALDDLAGCASILHALHSTIDSPSPCVGIFTRAEEVGLVGARLIAESGILDPMCVVVSIETSQKNELVKQGNGVAIRVGDILTTFDDQAENVLRTGIRSSSEPLNHQRALLGAGGCEASAFAAHGYRVTGTSLPLGAWHNQEEDGSITMEYVSESDFRSGVALIAAVIKSVGVEPIRRPGAALAKHPEAEAERLRRSAEEWLNQN